MSAKPCVLEFGMGVDVHGRDSTKAACRAVSDAIRHSSLPLFQEVRERGGRMLVDVTIGVPDPDSVKLDVVRRELPHGEVTVHAVNGGLRSPTSDTLIACAAITVSVEYPAGRRAMSLTKTGTGLKRLQHLVLWVVERRAQRPLLLRRRGLRGPATLSERRVPEDSRNTRRSQPRAVRAGRRGAARRARGAHVSLGLGGRRPHRPRARASAAHRRGGAGRIVESRREPVALRQGSGRARVRDLLDGARRCLGPDDRARSRGRALPARL